MPRREFDEAYDYSGPRRLSLHAIEERIRDVERRMRDEDARLQDIAARLDTMEQRLGMSAQPGVFLPPHGHHGDNSIGLA